MKAHGSRVFAFFFLVSTAALSLAQGPSRDLPLLRLGTSISEREADFASIRTFREGLEALGNAGVELLLYRQETELERTQRALADLQGRRIDLAIVGMPEIRPSPFFSYSLVPFVVKDRATAREQDLGLRAALDNRLADIALVALGTLPRLPRVIVAPLPRWNGSLRGAKVLATTRVEGEAFARLIGQAGYAPVPQMRGMLQPGVFAVVPMAAGIELARAAPELYLYDVRPAIPAMAVLTSRTAAGAPERREAIAEIVSALEATAWQRLDQFADEVLRQGRERGAKPGVLERDFGERYSELVLLSIDQSTRRSVSEDHQRQILALQLASGKPGPEQVYGKLCRTLEILLVTNRTLPNSLPFQSGMVLPGQGKELAAEVSSQSNYGIVQVQVGADDRDSRSALGECTDAAGNITADKGFRLQAVRLYSRVQFEQGARQANRALEPGAPFLLFVHGYNVNFADAVETIARLSIRTKHRLVPVLVSWPSAGRTAAYPWDGERAAKSDGAVRDALSALRAIAPSKRIQLVAHSMGNRIALAALASGSQPAGPPVGVEELVTVAPDVPCTHYADTMAAILSAKSGARRLVGRASLYLYEKDSALTASNIAHWIGPSDEKCRMGNQKGAVAARIRGVEAIDWSCIRDPVDSHSYYLHSNYIGGDLHAIVAEHKAPSDRELNRIAAGTDGGFFLHAGILDPKKCLPSR